MGISGGTVLNPPIIQEVDSIYNARDFRRITKYASGFQGVSAPGDMAVTAVGGTMNVSVATGHAVVNGTQDVNHQGAYIVDIFTATQVTLAPGDATYSRIDSIVLFIEDGEYAGTNYRVSVGAVQGTPAASPVAPTFASDGTYYELARVAVPAAATTLAGATIADKRTTRTSSGGSTATVLGPASPAQNATALTIGSIPQTGKLLRIRAGIRPAYAANSDMSAYLSFNGSSAAVIEYFRAVWECNVAGGYAFYPTIGNAVTAILLPMTIHTENSAPNAAGQNPSFFEVWIPGYSSPTLEKVARGMGGGKRYDVGAGGTQSQLDLGEIVAHIFGAQSGDGVSNGITSVTLSLVGGAGFDSSSWMEAIVE